MDSFVVQRRGVGPGRTYVVIARERDYVNGVNTLQGVICEDEMPRGGSPDRGLWDAQGIANIPLMDGNQRHVYCYVKGEDWHTLNPVFPIDDGEYAYCNVEGQEDYPTEPYNEFIQRMQKEGRWQGDKKHEKYPWKEK